MTKLNTGSHYQRDYMVEINEATTHEEIKSSDCRKIKFQKCFVLPQISFESTFASETYVRKIYLNNFVTELVQTKKCLMKTKNAKSSN